MDGVVYACDIGSVKSGSFAWARNTSPQVTPVASTEIEHLISSIISDAEAGFSIALGFEAPLFLPVPENSKDLNVGRPGESSRSIFAPAGAAVTTIAVQQTAWILKQLHSPLSHILYMSRDWRAPWHALPQKLFIWEAFVSATAHSDTHKRDATTAVQFFLENEDHLADVNAVTCDDPLSLIGAAGLWSGWLRDKAVLHSPCLVLRPDEPYTGPINPA